MRRRDLEHIIRAAATIADDDEIIVIGSQAILGQFPDAPAELCVSNEADVFPKNKPERTDLIDGSIGEGSPFHETYGYYAQGVGPGTATLPAGWQGRMVLSKWYAGRDKDRRFNRAAALAGLVGQALLLERLGAMRIDATRAEQIAREIRASFRPSPT